MQTLLREPISGLAHSNLVLPGHKSLSLSSFGVPLGISGADTHGFNQASDILVQESADGVDLAQMWAEFQATLAIHNRDRTLLVGLLTFPVTRPFEQVTQLSGSKFEIASEYGEPRGVRQAPTSFWLGYTYEDYDIAERYTWRFLRDADARQIEALHSSIIEADNQNMFVGVMSALYGGNTNRTADINDQPYNVYGLYNADGTVPPTYKSQVFDGAHTHYLVSGAVNIEPGDLEDMIEHLRHHGYGSDSNTMLIFGLNSREGKVVRGFRQGTNGASYDFIPASGEPLDLILEPGQVIAGRQPASSYRGLNVIGQYGNAIIIEDDLFPPAYALLVGSGGAGNLNNPVGLREHAKPSERGLRLIKGRDNDYPLTDAFYMRGFGTGVRQRGGAVVMQIKASGSYVAPTQYLY